MGTLQDLLNSGMTRDEINALLSQSMVSTPGFDGGAPEPQYRENGNIALNSARGIPVMQGQPKTMAEFFAQPQPPQPTDEPRTMDQFFAQPQPTRNPASDSSEPPRFTVGDDGLKRMTERPGVVEQARLNTIRNNTTGVVTDLSQYSRPQHDVYRDGPQVLQEFQNPDGTIERIVKKPTTDGFGRQSTIVVRETITPDYLNPAMIAKDKMEKARADIAHTQMQTDPVKAAEYARQVAIGKQQGELTGFNTMAQQNATGPNALSGLPPAMADQVKALAEGRMAFPSGFALKSPYWQQMLQLVSQYDPSFDAINYNTRAATRKDFTSGKSAENIKALNTALGHLDTIQQKFNALDNSKYPSYNTAANWLGEHLGNEEVQKAVGGFNTAKLAVSGEMAKVFRSVGMSQQEIQHWLDRLSASQSPADFNSTLKTAADLMQGRLDAIGDQYSKGMGTMKTGLDLLSPDAKKTLENLSSGSKPKLTNIDAEALAWAMKNPTDHRADEIKAKLGVK